ncbi:MAG: hypothetical protein J0H74_30530 [Chitinophagaceae bacterium]|nr:hypothetical protein [Chitinophagaceae bacterium]
MRLKLLYTLVLILCLSAFASSKNECTHPIRDCNSGSSKNSPAKAVKELSKEVSEDEVRPQEFSTFQFVKFLYI